MTSPEPTPTFMRDAGDNCQIGLSVASEGKPTLCHAIRIDPRSIPGVSPQFPKEGEAGWQLFAAPEADPERTYFLRDDAPTEQELGWDGYGLLYAEVHNGQLFLILKRYASEDEKRCNKVLLIAGLFVLHHAASKSA